MPENLNITYNLDHTAHLHFQFWWQQKDIFTTLTESNLKVLFERGCVIHIYIPEKYPNMLLWFSQIRLILCQKMRRSRFRILSTAKTVLCDKSEQLKAINCSHRNLHLRCGRGPKSNADWDMHSSHGYGIGAWL